MTEPEVYEIVNPDVCHCERCQMAAGDGERSIHGVTFHALIELEDDHKADCWCENEVLSDMTVYNKSLGFHREWLEKQFNVKMRTGPRPAWL